MPRLWKPLAFLTVAAGFAATLLWDPDKPTPDGGPKAAGSVDAVRRGAMVRLLRDSVALTLNLVTFGRVGSRPTIESPGVATIPYGVPMAIGAVAWWFFGGELL